jgi:hypothetical protein
MGHIYIYIHMWSRNQRLEDQKGCIRECEEFKYLGVKIDKENRQENDTRNKINKGREITVMLNSVLWSRKISRKNKLMEMDFLRRSGEMFKIRKK